MLSRACEYAIQAAIYMAKKPRREYTLIREISKELNIPHHFLGKIMQSLVKKGIMISHKGPKGGLALSKKASEISMLDVVTAIDGSDFTSRCIIGLKKCEDTSKCPLHITWCDKRENLKEMFSAESLAKLVKDLELTSQN
ncbi:MAG: Rrf2 family transcriptional regulator [Thermodesulfobacteriota bacterium]